VSFNREGLDNASRPKRIACVPGVVLRKLGRSRFSAGFQERSPRGLNGEFDAFLPNRCPLAQSDPNWH